MASTQTVTGRLGWQASRSIFHSQCRKDAPFSLMPFISTRSASGASKNLARREETKKKKKPRTTFTQPDLKDAL
ncbi:hypothetical protein MMC20_001237, partial [Loxospora ochrophaea]|nr:hypothetical protein [Loxospora ochrophaea]